MKVLVHSGTIGVKMCTAWLWTNYVILIHSPLLCSKCMLQHLYIYDVLSQHRATELLSSVLIKLAVFFNTERKKINHFFRTTHCNRDEGCSKFLVC